jgi:hypothetical protein
MWIASQACTHTALICFDAMTTWADERAAQS